MSLITISFYEVITYAERVLPLDLEKNDLSLCTLADYSVRIDFCKDKEVDWYDEFKKK